MEQSMICSVTNDNGLKQIDSIQDSFEFGTPVDEKVPEMVVL